ncbi:MAG: hypothetical protein NZ902_02345 [Acidilobaceae archaeon]|nr:hypothetical protein [Acidilobaceae archaeon]MCX8165659.1 hypothetical protein [Acidilobaceae archaeon]MDW7974084.1 hypothetical protein [Sulfolobales archaeon]
MKLTAYVGSDWRSRLAERVLKDLAVYLASNYGIGVELELIELPIGDLDEEELPIIILEGETVSRGEVPSMSSLMELIFEKIETSTETLFGFPTLEA